jgi:GWxTD domain-containing protein
MLPSILISPWNELGAGMANHIWQSTLCLIILGALTLLFRRNSAVVRYRLWLIASVKFLVPFSLFVALGSWLDWHPVRTVTPTEVPVVVRQISQPFTSAPIELPTPSFVKAAPVANPSLPIVFAVVWFGGAAMVLLVWCVQWLQVARIVRNAAPLSRGGTLPGIRILTARAHMEPGVFGIFRPVLLLPESATHNLSAAQLEPIIAHEMFHVRGRDNLAAAMHTVVEAFFWFHPLVWWLGSRLVDERERACDEAVLQMGHDPADYAEGILRVCKSNVMTPACLAGVSGSNLKKRIEVIMENRGTNSLTGGKKLLLTIAGTGVLMVPVFAGMTGAAESPIAVGREMQLPVIESATSAALPVLSQLTAPTGGQSPLPSVQAAPQASTIRVNALPVIENGSLTMLPVLSLVAVPSPQQAPPAVPPVTGQQKWLDDVSIIISDAEKRAFQQLTNDQQRQGFITNFWLARDPTPGTAANEFKDEYDKRVAYANEHFTTQSGIPGSKTDRGKMYVLNGPPDEVVGRRAIRGRYRGTGQGNNFVADTETFPAETWRYRHIDGTGDNLMYEFVDRLMNGEYTLEYDPTRKVGSTGTVSASDEQLYRTYRFTIGRPF